MSRSALAQEVSKRQRLRECAHPVRTVLVGTDNEVPRRSSSHFHPRRLILLPVLLATLLTSHECHAAIKCDATVGGGTCPDNNTCCPLINAAGHRIRDASSCLPPNKHIGVGQGVCCGRSMRDSVWGEAGMTGCPVGYRCATNIDEDGNFVEYCRRVADSSDVDVDVIKSGNGKIRENIDRHNIGVQAKRKLLRGSNLHLSKGICSNATDALQPPIFPRYSLCTLPPEALEVVHGFRVKEKSDWELAYYSNMGSVTSDAKPNVRFVLISVHGSSRNADDYLCAAHSASRLQERYPSDAVLVVAPRFLAPEDRPVPAFQPTQASGATPLRWNETYPIAHTWRYGADSIQGGISSYAALDALIKHLVLDPQGLYPNLETIVLAGHSAGGQFAQRYAMLSPSPILDGRIYVSMDSSAHRARSVEFRSVAANPRSYCYLDGRRPEGGGYKVPNEHEIAECPRYNQWQWGLDAGGDVVAPYKDRAIDAAGGVDELVKRFLQRNMIYLAGTQDIIPLQGLCEDDLFQGRCRLERAHVYFKYLQTLYNSRRHVFKEVDGSNHVSEGAEIMFRVICVYYGHVIQISFNSNILSTQPASSKSRTTPLCSKVSWG